MVPDISRLTKPGYIHLIGASKYGQSQYIERRHIYTRIFMRQSFNISIQTCGPVATCLITKQTFIPEKERITNTRRNSRSTLDDNMTS